MKRFAPLSFLFAGCLLIARCATAQQKPEDALVEIAMAQDEATILAHMPKVMVSELEHVPQQQREEFLRVFMLQKSLAAEGIELSRSSENPSEFQFLQENGERARLVFSETHFDGDSASVHFLIVTTQTQTPAIVHVRREDGVWRLINIEAQGKRLLPNLDDREQIHKELTTGKSQAEEATAVGSLRTINTAAVIYSATYPEVGLPPDLLSLGSPPDGTNAYTEHHAGILSPELACPDTLCIRSGYKIYYQRLDKEHYRVSAMPVAYGVNGSRSFFSNETGVIRATSENREAHESDEPLQ